MIDYIYDGTFEGLLTCIYSHYYTDRAAGIYRQGEYQPNMLNGFLELETDPQKAMTVYEAISKKISVYDLRRMYRAFLSNDPEKEMKILRYAVMGFKVGGRISLLHGNSVVADLQSLDKKISVETERMLQFVRFSVMENGVLYARIEPDNDVLELLHNHFCARFINEPFIIHDAGRDKAMAAYQKHWYITEFTEADVPALSSEEQEYRSMWKCYFDNIAIKERKNSRCQKNFMPVRYWKNLTECQL